MGGEVVEDVEVLLVTVNQASICGIDRILQEVISLEGLIVWEGRDSVLVIFFLDFCLVWIVEELLVVGPFDLVVL